ncbi:sigma-54-dependent transcriptional regulator [Pseudobacteriovorax antillogorgiicola]|uniref:Two component, sigma54 specific, transcriptional regulator, Fis family n=1 Tax=Pseudobacteriovorax antillogorgiicola TaxID=1513793 RepID=A0A1Y6CJY9_9BACT|nr:sigma-54 dependent transcriptional regulator [Pseudobacteriovorax antillogorgiicola]TCS45882.1 two component Fis family sigma54 specific transcriptional regulator [Pseudobacteriovorax antillogorgiicola]SMF71222.1 two component, sigma54 specific, transcriptional regulator, Fis family [Pseudobacteriovorax antillogorgiicola]
MSDTSVVNSLSGSRILVVDDHRNIRLSLKMTLEGEGAIVTEAETYAQALIKLGSLSEAQAIPFDVVLLDIRLPDGNGLDVLKLLSHHKHASQVIMISGEGTVKEAFAATKLGAFDYIEKPFVPERILVSIGRCLDFNNIQVTNKQLSQQVMKGQEILGQTPAVEELKSLISRVAPTNGRVLILGESGTGKELIAKSVHRQSQRAKKPMVKVNCAAIPHSLVESELFGHEKGAFTGATKNRKGLFEQADGGTLFLDEIGELDLNVQAKLLRTLQSGEIIPVGSETVTTVDVRLIAATHRDLEGMVANGEFREDLFYRLNVVTIVSPPLRERKDDLDILVNHFVEDACQEHAIPQRSVTPTAMAELKAYHWPGNIRELRNVIEREVILSDSAEIDSVSSLSTKVSPVATTSTQSQQTKSNSLSKTTPPGDAASFSFESEVVPWQELHQAIGKSYIKYVLNKTQGNVSEAARVLCLERAYLHRLMKKLGIQRGVVVTD